MGNSLRVPAFVDEVRRVCAFIQDVARSAGMAEWAIFHCELAVEEAFVNIAAYGFEGYEADAVREFCYVDIQAETDGKALIITICDNSPPFNPLESETPHITTNIQKIETGGLGIHFYKKLMDQVEYEYSNGENRLTLRKSPEA
jgi:serine/threonine-protein kinase RsbW